MKSRYRTWLAVPPEETEAVKCSSPLNGPQSCRMGSEKALVCGRVPNFHCWSAGYPGHRNCRWMPAIRSLNLLRSWKTPGWLFRDCHRWTEPYTEWPPDDKKGPKVAHTGPILMVVPPAGTATTGAPMTVPQTGYFPAENNTILWPDCICGHSLSNSAMITHVNCSNSITNRPAMPAPILTVCHRQQHMNT